MNIITISREFGSGGREVGKHHLCGVQQGSLGQNDNGKNPDDEAGQVCGRLRSLWSITIMLVNDRKESPVKANRCIFQAKIKISSENNDFIFVERNCVNFTLRFPIYPPFHTSSHPQSLHQPHKPTQLFLRH